MCVERQIPRGGGRARGRHRDGQQCVGAEAALRRRSRRGRRAPRPPHAAPVTVPFKASAMVLLMFATAFRTPFPRYRAGSPSRSSRASRAPVEAPDGTAALPSAPPAQTSASTVGLPRESRISRPRTRVISTSAPRLCSLTFALDLEVRPSRRRDRLASSASSASSLIEPMSGSSSAVTTTTPPSVTEWRVRSSVLVEADERSRAERARRDR